MSRIAKRFSDLASKNRKALITYVVAGDPTLDITNTLMHEMVASGADLLELGVPFSDPIAEGPIIQAAHERALSNSVTLTKIFEVVSRFRRKDKDTPVVLMGYANPIERMGYEKFARVASGEQWDKLGFSIESIYGTAHDIRTYYEELACEIAESPIEPWATEQWFYDSTEAGQIILKARRAMRDNKVDKSVWFGLAPAGRE